MLFSPNYTENMDKMDVSAPKTGQSHTVFQNIWRNSYMAGEKYAARKVFWADIIHQYNQSGMVKNEWFKQHGISSKSFYYW